MISRMSDKNNIQDKNYKYYSLLTGRVVLFFFPNEAERYKGRNDIEGKGVLSTKTEN